MLPKDIDYFTGERSRIIAQLLQVTDAPQLKNIGEVMKQEVDCAMKSDFTEMGLPLLLHEVLYCKAFLTLEFDILYMAFVELNVDLLILLAYPVNISQVVFI